MVRRQSLVTGRQVGAGRGGILEMAAGMVMGGRLIAALLQMRPPPRRSRGWAVEALLALLGL